MTKQSQRYYVYLLANKICSVLYCGVTNNLIRRMFEHKNKEIKGFTSKYNIDRLVYYEVFDNIEFAIQREKQLKGGSREDKVKLIDDMNPAWDDLYEVITQ